MSAEFALWMFPALMVMIFMGFPVAFSLLSVAFVFGATAVQLLSLRRQRLRPEGRPGGGGLRASARCRCSSSWARSWSARGLRSACSRRSTCGRAACRATRGGHRDPVRESSPPRAACVGATESVVGLLAIPVMLRYAYDKGLISGTICAGGSLGTVIPPSVIVVILGPVAEVDVGGLFMGMLFPGLLLAGLFILYILVRCTIPAARRAAAAARRERPVVRPQAGDHRGRAGAAAHPHLRGARHHPARMGDPRPRPPRWVRPARSSWSSSTATSPGGC